MFTFPLNKTPLCIFLLNTNIFKHVGKFSFFTENFSVSNDFEKLEMAFILRKNKLQI